MSATSGTSLQRTFWDLNDVTSSRELRDGTPPSTSLDGPPDGPSGPLVSPASRSLRRARGKAKTTSATSGPSSSVSSASAALGRSAASRLLAAMDTGGSMEYVMTWRRKVLPSGLVIYRLAA